MRISSQLWQLFQPRAVCHGGSFRKWQGAERGCRCWSHHFAGEEIQSQRCSLTGKLHQFAYVCPTKSDPVMFLRTRLQSGIKKIGPQWSTLVSSQGRAVHMWCSMDHLHCHWTKPWCNKELLRATVYPWAVCIFQWISLLLGAFSRDTR